MDWDDIALQDQNEQWLAKDAEDKKKEEAEAGYKKEEIKSEGDYEDKGIDTPWSEGRGKWFVIAEYKSVKLLIGPVGTEKKANDALKDFHASMNPDTNTDDVSVQNDVSETHFPHGDIEHHQGEEPMTEDNQIPVGPEETAKINGIIDEVLESGEGLVVTTDDLVVEMEDEQNTPPEETLEGPSLSEVEELMKADTENNIWDTEF